MQLTNDLADRLIQAETRCYVDWMRAFQALPDNPFNAQVAYFGNATAVTCRTPAEIWNRVFGLTPPDLHHLPAIQDFYKAHNATMMLDLSPYHVPAYWHDSKMTLVLSRDYGLFQGAFAQMLYGTPALEVPTTPSHIELQPVTETNMGDFAWTYEQVWGDGREVTVLAAHPHFRCTLAYVEGKPAALGVLHIADGAASMANGLTAPEMRGKGAQTALLYHRIRQAAEEGCDLLVSQCAPGSISQHNQLKVGFKIAGTKAWWMPVA